MEQMNKKQQHTTMRKRFITLMFAVFVAVGPALAQVFITEDEINKNRTVGDGVVFNVMVGAQDVQHDQYLPLGSGTAILFGLGAAYLVAKKRREE